MPTTSLNESIIRQHLSTLNFNEPIHFHLMESIDSTNQFLKDLTQSNTIDLCCAETQTQGRGRFGRSWHSPFGENIYCSIRWRFDCELSHLSGLGLVISMAIIATLKDVGIEDDIRVKWPNDLLWEGRKLCGSLIEVMNREGAALSVVIGVGLNVNSITQDHPLENKSWCSLYDITGKKWDRNLLIAHLFAQLDQHLQQFIGCGLKSFLPTWQKVDYLYNHNITVSHRLEHLSGRANGIDEKGQLILMDTLGVTHYLSSGDTSLQLSNKPG